MNDVLTIVPCLTDAAMTFGSSVRVDPLPEMTPEQLEDSFTDISLPPRTQAQRNLSPLFFSATRSRTLAKKRLTRASTVKTPFMDSVRQLRRLKPGAKIPIHLLPRFEDFPDLKQSLESARSNGLIVRMATVEEEGQMESQHHNAELTTDRRGKSQLILNRNALKRISFYFTFAHEVAHLLFEMLTQVQDSSHASTVHGLKYLLSKMNLKIRHKWNITRKQLSDSAPPFSAQLAMRGIQQQSPRHQFEEDTYRFLNEWYAYERELAVYRAEIKKRPKLRTEEQDELAGYSFNQLMKIVAERFHIPSEIVNIFMGVHIVDIVR